MKKILLIFLFSILLALNCGAKNKLDYDIYMIEFESHHVTFAKHFKHVVPVILIKQLDDKYLIAWGILDLQQINIFYEYNAPQLQIIHDNQYMIELQPVQFHYKNKEYKLDRTDLLLKKEINNFTGLIHEAQGYAAASEYVELVKANNLNSKKIKKLDFKPWNPD